MSVAPYAPQDSLMDIMVVVAIGSCRRHRSDTARYACRRPVLLAYAAAALPPRSACHSLRNKNKGLARRLCRPLFFSLLVWGGRFPPFAAASVAPVALLPPLPCGSLAPLFGGGVKEVPPQKRRTSLIIRRFHRRIIDSAITAVRYSTHDTYVKGKQNVSSLARLPTLDIVSLRAFLLTRRVPKHSAKSHYKPCHRHFCRSQLTVLKMLTYNRP